MSAPAGNATAGRARSSRTGAEAEHCVDQEIDMGFARYHEPARELARASTLGPAGRLLGWRKAWLSASMGGQVRASRPRSAPIIAAGCSVLAGSISLIPHLAHPCGLPAIPRCVRGARLK